MTLFLNDPERRKRINDLFNDEKFLKRLKALEDIMKKHEEMSRSNVEKGKKLPEKWKKILEFADKRMKEDKKKKASDAVDVKKNWNKIFEGAKKLLPATDPKKKKLEEEAHPNLTFSAPTSKQSKTLTGSQQFSLVTNYKL